MQCMPIDVNASCDALRLAYNEHKCQIGGPNFFSKSVCHWMIAVITDSLEIPSCMMYTISKELIMIPHFDECDFHSHLERWGMGSPR